MAATPDLRRYLRGVASLASSWTGAGAEREALHAAALTAVALHIGRAEGLDVAGADLRLFRRAREPLDDQRLVPPPALVAPELLGHVHAALLAGTARRRGGVFITPAAVAGPLVEATLAPLLHDRPEARVCDPAVGGGAFLLAAARRLAAHGVPLPHAVGRCVFGSDLDALAVETAEAALAILGWDGGPPPGLAGHLVAGDPLLERDLLPVPFDAVVANPPFLNQLERQTARSRRDAAALVERFGDAVRGYADGAAVFLLLGLDLVRPGGRIGMILPDSVLAARDAGRVRLEVGRRASVDWVWLGGTRVFDASVAVCALVAEPGSPQRQFVARTSGPDFAPMPPLPAAELRADGSWGALAATALGVPPVDVAAAGSVGDWSSVTADFRDQFYGLAPLVEEATGGAADRLVPVLTCGLIDPAIPRWGTRVMRIGGRRFVRPVVDLARLDRETDLGPWAKRRLVPKVVVATQTRVIEAVVDESGGWLPSTPVITVEVAPPRAWHVAAALMAPPISALALRACAGAALTPDAIKLTAKQVAALPLPRRGPAWDAGAAAVRRAAAATTEEAWRAALHDLGASMCAAYAVANHDEVLTWWEARVPKWRPGD